MFRSKIAIALSSFVAALTGIGVASCWSRSITSDRDVERSVGAQQLSAERMGISRTSLTSACNDDAEVSVSPSGKFFAIAKGMQGGFSPLPRSNSLTIFSTECLARGGNCGVAIQGLDGVRIAGWDSESQHVILDENGRFLTALKLPIFPSDPISLERVAARELSSKIVVLEPLSSTDVAQGIVEMLDAAERDSQRAMGPNVPLVYAMDRSGLFATLVEARPSLRWAFRQGTRNVELPIITPQARHPRLVAGHADATVSFLDLGILITANRAGKISVESRPLMNPLQSSSTGTIAGWYGPQRPSAVLNGDGSQAPAAISATPGPLAEAYLISAATNGHGSSAMVFDSGSGLTELVFRHRERRWSVTCPSYESSVKFHLKYRDLGLPTRALPIVMGQPLETSPKGIAVIFGGGPAERADDIRSSAPALNFLKRGYEVWLVTYSGSRGGGYGVSMRLAAGALQELENDGAIIARALQARGHVPVILFGTSFGALPALATDVALKSSHRSIYVAPFFKHRNPAEWIKPGPFSADAGFQAMVENAALGISSDDQYRRFNQSIEELLHRRSRVSPQLSIHFDKDMVSQQNDQGTATMGDIVVLPGFHFTATTSPRTWSTISRWLATTDGLGK